MTKRFWRMTDDERMRAHQAEYYANRLAGVHGSTEEVAEDMRRWSVTNINWPSWFMRWDELAIERAREIETRREIVGHPHVCERECYAAAMRELIGELTGKARASRAGRHGLDVRGMSR